MLELKAHLFIYMDNSRFQHRTYATKPDYGSIACVRYDNCQRFDSLCKLLNLVVVDVATTVIGIAMGNISISISYIQKLKYKQIIIENIYLLDIIRLEMSIKLYNYFQNNLKQGFKTEL